MSSVFENLVRQKVIELIGDTNWDIERYIDLVIEGEKREREFPINHVWTFDDIEYLIEKYKDLYDLLYPEE